MIKSFGNKTTEKIYNETSVKGFAKDILKKALRKLRMLDAAEKIEDLIVPPSNRLERMKGKWKRFHSISVTMKYRIWFIWKDGEAHDVTFGDYHDRLK